MITVYNLVMVDTESSYNNHLEEFNIGFFSTYEKAEKTARRFLKEVNGFKDHDINYHITEKSVIGSIDNSMMSEVFIIYGWNENDDLDEIDVIESSCYSTLQKAKQHLNVMKEGCSRKEWCISKYSIDECEWQEGYIKEYD